MLELLGIVVGIFDLLSLVLAAGKHWRISCGLLAAASMVVVICLLVSSPALRWIVGFHVFALILMLAVVWEQKRGKLKD